MALVLLAALVASVSAQAIIRSQPYTPDISKDYNLLDTVLVATVDGKFHAVNRTSGHTLWSMSSFITTTSVSAPSSLSPLVKTSHSEEPDDEETYIIEPQSGDIYVLHSPSSPLQRFPFSIPELVDLSPFTSVNEKGETVFLGRKETSLLLIELETGKIKATLNAECPFIPEDHIDENTQLDLDELEGSKPPVSAPTQVYIGRTGTLGFINLYRPQSNLRQTTLSLFTKNPRGGCQLFRNKNWFSLNMGLTTEITNCNPCTNVQQTTSTFSL